MKYAPFEAIEKHLSINMNYSKKAIFLHNFIGGIAWGIGTVVGATILISLLYGILTTLDAIPFVDIPTQEIIQSPANNRMVK